MMKFNFFVRFTPRFLIELCQKSEKPLSINDIEDFQYSTDKITENMTKKKFGLTFLKFGFMAKILPNIYGCC